MALFTKKTTIRENRIENVGRWPIRLTEFYLVDDYEFPPSRFTEIFLVRSGNFLHETETGTQAVRSGTAMVHHPASRHVVKQPDQVRLARVRFLPEWFAGDFASLMGSPDALSLLFVPSWFQVPLENRLHVFTTRETQQPHLAGLFDLLRQVLRAGRHAEPISRVTLLEIMLLLGDEYQVYWRGGNRLDLPPSLLGWLDLIERSIASGGRLPLKQLQTASGKSQEDLNQIFRKHLGLSLVEYSQGRRAHHAAWRLLSAPGESPAEISAAFGFSDVTQFEKACEKAFGLAPEAYRMKFGNATGAGDDPAAAAIASQQGAIAGATGSDPKPETPGPARPGKAKS